MVKSPLIRAAKQVEKAYRDIANNSKFARYIYEPLDYEKSSLLNREIHILGEIHGSRAQYDYFRTNLQKEVSKDRKNWIFFIEGGLSNKVKVCPEEFYFGLVSKLYKIPTFDATSPNLFSPEVRAYVKDKTGMNKETFYGMLYGFFSEGREDSMLGSNANISIVARNLNVDLDSAKEITERGPISGDFYYEIGIHWNRLIRKTFMNTLEANPDRNRVMVTCGKQHNIAFLD